MDSGLDRLPQRPRSFHVSRRCDDALDSESVASGGGTSSSADADIQT